MGDDLYKLIPEEGKHLAESRNTKGAYRGVYLGYAEQVFSVLPTFVFSV